jgi:hypothetical protein
MHALISPVPAYVRALDGSNITTGERVGTFGIWPTAHPAVKLQRGDRFSFSLKVTTGELDKRIMDLGAESPGNGNQSSGNGVGGNGSQNGNGSYQAPPPETELPADKISYKVRREGSLSNYWIDFDVSAPDNAGVFRRTITMNDPAELAGLQIEVKVTVLDKNLIVVPDTVDAGEISVQALKNGEIELGRVGIRKQEGEFHIKSITSTIPFIKVVAQPIFVDKNYLLHVRASGDGALHPGNYDGKLIIETDDKYVPRAEVSVKLTLVP